jgi:hypothetical protein
MIKAGCRNTGISLLFSIATIAGASSPTLAQPAPGDVFREYRFYNEAGDAGGAIRVGGKQGVSYPDRGSDHNYINAWMDFPGQLNLQHAIRAEVVVEKILSHNGTTGLAIQWNDGQWIPLPPPATLPQPAADYYHHTCITTAIPLDVLRSGDDATNRFRLRVNPDQPWNWPQHLIYGVHLRIYYVARQVSCVTGRLLTPSDDSSIGRHVPLTLEIPDRFRRVNRVDYLAKYEGVNWEGDGVYRRWHYFYYHGQLCHHVGSSVTAPFDLTWDTSWIPDQTEPVEIAAWITDDTGLTFMTPAVSGLQLQRPGLSVELCRPQNVPENWVTRNDEYTQTVTVEGNPAAATAAKLLWSSWSPGYMNGLFLNDTRVLDKEGPRYRYYDHAVPLQDLTALKPGTNTIRTGKTPKYDGKMVHGMEVNWPGIQLLIQYERP